jgi:hypothetical protein
MRKAMYAVSVACVLTFGPELVLRLDSQAKFVSSLKYIAGALWAPGAFVGLIAASGRVHDIDLWVTGAANFVFYFTITWLLLRGFSRIKTHET